MMSGYVLFHLLHYDRGINPFTPFTHLNSVIISDRFFSSNSFPNSPAQNSFPPIVLLLFFELLCLPNRGVCFIMYLKIFAEIFCYYLMFTALHFFLLSIILYYCLYFTFFPFSVCGIYFLVSITMIFNLQDYVQEIFFSYWRIVRTQL
jgi:hypothetical protein